MAALNTQNFDTLADGTLPPGWIIPASGGFGLLARDAASRSVTAISGAMVFLATGAGEHSLYTGSGVLGAQEVKFKARVPSMVLTSFRAIGVRLRSAIDSAGHYTVKLNSDGTNLALEIQQYFNGTPATSGFILPAVAPGDIVHIEARAVGTTIEGRFWVNGAARPTAATVSYTDAGNAHPTGYPGVVLIGENGTAFCDDLVVTDSAGGADFYDTGDTTAPVLTLPTGASTGTTTASGTVTTDEGNGTLYFLASINATETVAAVKASTGTQAITTTGSKSVAFTGLTAGTLYYAHYVHTDAALNNSLRVTSTSFTTAAAGDTTPPTLTSPTGTQTGPTTASGTVSTNEANGTLYRLASINATETVAAIKAAALTTTVTTTGVQSVTFTGLTPSTLYYTHYVHRDAAGNDSIASDSVDFTTAAAGVTFAASGVQTNMQGGLRSGACRVAITNLTTDVLVAVKTGLTMTAGVVPSFTIAGPTAGVEYEYKTVMDANPLDRGIARATPT